MSFDARQLIASLNKLADLGGAAVAQFSEHVLTESKEICPVSSSQKTIRSEATGKKIKNPNHTGHPRFLQDSGTVVVRREGDTIVAEVGYNANYAAAVHERLDVNHNYPGTGNPKGQAKFLEIPFRENAPNFAKFVADEVRNQT